MTVITPSGLNGLEPSKLDMVFRLEGCCSGILPSIICRTLFGGGEYGNSLDTGPPPLLWGVIIGNAI